MATTTYTDNVEILGSDDKTQLLVKGHTTQTEPLQEWQNGSAVPVAEITPEGRLRVGGNLGLSAPSALVEANADLTPSASVKQGWQSLGTITGALTEALSWVVHELQLLGAGGVSSIYSGLRARLLFSNSGGSSGSLRAAEFQAVSEAHTGTVSHLTGVHSSLQHNPEGGDGQLSLAIGVEVESFNTVAGTITDLVGVQVNQPTNEGTIGSLYGLRLQDMQGATSNYAIHTGKGLVHLGDVVEVAEQAAAPATPPSGYLALYAKTDGKMYAKNDTGIEYDLTSTGGDTPLTEVFSGTELGAVEIVGADVDTIEFDDIPSGYDYVELVGVLLTDIAATAANNQPNIRVYFNDDTTSSNYYYAWRDSGDSSGNYSGTDTGGGYAADNASTSTNLFRGIVHNYDDASLYKAAQFTAHIYDASYGMILAHVSIAWKNTNAITKITLDLNVGAQFRAGTKVKLIGYKNQAVTGSASPDYDSGWFGVAANTTYTKAHGLGTTPRQVTLWHSAVASPGANDELVQVGQLVPSDNLPRNAVGVDGTNIYIQTTDTSHGATVFSLRRTSNTGYYRVLAWK